MADAKNRTDSVTMETGPVICGRCRRTFAHFVIEEISGIAQLRAGDLLIPKIDANCLHCGWGFHWNIREKDVEKMTVTYQAVLARIQVYNPE